MCYHDDDTAPATIPSAHDDAPAGQYGIRLSVNGDESAVFGDARYATHAAARRAIDTHPDIVSGEFRGNYAVRWLGAPEDHTAFSIIISDRETVTAELSVRDGGVDTYLTNTLFPSDPLVRRFDGLTLDEARDRIVAEGEAYRSNTRLLAQLEAMLSGVSVG